MSALAMQAPVAARAFSPEVELLIAARNFAADPRDGRDRLRGAVDMAVQGQLHERLRKAARDALDAPAGELPGRLRAIDQAIRDIGAAVEARRSAGQGDLLL